MNFVGFYGRIEDPFARPPGVRMEQFKIVFSKGDYVFIEMLESKRCSVTKHANLTLAGTVKESGDKGFTARELLENYGELQEDGRMLFEFRLRKGGPKFKMKTNTKRKDLMVVSCGEDPEEVFLDPSARFPASIVSSQTEDNWE